MTDRLRDLLSLSKKGQDIVNFEDDVVASARAYVAELRIEAGKTRQEGECIINDAIRLQHLADAIEAEIKGR